MSKHKSEDYKLTTVKYYLDNETTYKNTLFEGVAADMVLNGVNGEASGSTPNQNLDLHSITT